MTEMKFNPKAPSELESVTRQVIYRLRGRRKASAPCLKVPELPV